MLKDNDAEVTRAALKWAEAEGRRIGEAAPELVTNLSLSDADIDALAMEERTQAKKRSQLRARRCDSQRPAGKGDSD